MKLHGWFSSALGALAVSVTLLACAGDDGASTGTDAVDAVDTAVGGDTSEGTDTGPDVVDDTAAAPDTDTDTDTDTADMADAADAADALDVEDTADTVEPDVSDDADAADDGSDASDGVSDASDDVADDTDAADTADTTAPTGPQLIASDPADGDLEAPSSFTITLTFDRPVDPEAAWGKLTGTSDLVADATELAPGPCPPPADATCLAVYLTPFRAGNPPLLVPGVRYTVRLDKSFPDLDGHENATDIVISFTTAEEGVVRVLGPADETVRGLDYDPGSRALFYAAVDGATNRDAVYKMPIVDGLVGFAALFTRLGDGVQRFGGLDVLDSKLWLSLTGIGRVWVFDGLGGEAGVFSREIHLTTLDAPYDSLIQVTSVAAVGAGARLLFAFGHYFGIDRPAGLIELTDGPTPTWSIFGAGAFSTEGSFAVAAPAAPNDDVVYVASEDEIVALSAATGARLGAVPYSSVDAKLRVDSRGRLWAAGGLELTVFAPAETGVFTVIKRGLGPTNELALVERGNQVMVYWTKVWDTRELRRTVFTFCDDGEVSCTPSCEDGEQDYDETGVDCGGGCDRCDVGGGCESARDCLSGICGDGVCREDTGCADGTREGFVDIAPFPDIAGCSGAWSVPGVVTAAAPACGRRAGDDGELPSGAGCNVADLCAEGWHVCADFGDVADATSFGGCEGAVTTSEPLFFVTRQGSLGNAACPLFGGGANDLFGCGSLGNAPGAGCAPLDRTSGDLCLALGPPWACGADAANEANNVTKTGSDAGGVLCCRGPQ